MIPRVSDSDTGKVVSLRRKTNVLFSPDSSGNPFCDSKKIATDSGRMCERKIKVLLLKKNPRICLPLRLIMTKVMMK
ncbi:MAG: hypothetical protein M0D53_11055 [Flavobacterium sp. JAD_PAG50586_2]|nr:MAG: hypothetical protein M0D53_11055 [Flavobacterium sp. JAD_PAG50586_2]